MCFLVILSRFTKRRQHFDSDTSDGSECMLDVDVHTDGGGDMVLSLYKNLLHLFHYYSTTRH